MIRDGKLLNIIYRTLATVGGILMAVALLSLLAGCAAWGQDRWYVNEYMKPTLTYEWMLTSSVQETQQKCGRPMQWRPEGSYSIACAIRLQGRRHCIVISHIPESVAKDYVIYGTESVWSHEITKHCGMNPEGIVWDHD